MLRRRIAQLGIIACLGLAAIAGVAVLTMGNLDKLQRRADTASDLALLSSAVHATFLQARLLEKSFLLRPDETDAARHARLLDRVETRHATLRRMVENSRFSPEFTAKLAEFETGLATYREVFAEVSANLRRTGFDENKGLQGAFRNAIHDVEAKLIEGGDAHLTSIMLQIRRREKDFMLRREVTYIDQLHEHVSEFQVALSESALPGAAKAQIARRMTEYQRDLTDFVKGQQAAQNSSKALSDTYARVEPGLSDIVAALRTADQDTQREIEGAWRRSGRALMALVAGVLLLAAGTFALVGRTIAKALSELHATDQSIQKQNERFQAALSNMSQGLSMFDADKRLVICNRRYVDLYRLPAELTRSGTALVDILEYSTKPGRGKSEQYRSERLLRAESRQRHTDIIELDDGRLIEILHDPMPNGGWVATHEDVTERRQAEARIAYLATHDALTDLPNRALFREKLDGAVAGAESGVSFAVHCLDLDRFKDVNDTLGHPAGDELLRQAAERLRSALRKQDVVARLGGDEFAILQCPIAGPQEASALAERVIELVGRPVNLGGQEVVVTPSIGMVIGPADGQDPDQLLKNADLALYRAKADGRGTFRFFEKGMDARLQARRQFESDLRAALGKGELEVFYQPVLEIETESITAFEALIRWRHPTRGMVSPLDLIPVAEETGLIVPIGEWVLRQACAEATKWPAPIGVAVNLSPVQFKDRSLVGAVMSALATTGLSPERLELEVTESVLLQNTEATVATMEKLRGLGVRLAMDDFGTGYSSLSYLRSFPFDRIKIDRSFVRDLATKQDCTAIVHAIAEMARKLGMRTTAEGVETEEHLAILRCEGCTDIQGYLVSPPRPAQEIAALLAKYGQGRNAVRFTAEKRGRISAAATR